MSKMILVDEKTVKQALDALEHAHDESLDDNGFECRQILKTQITAMRQALEQQPAAPVGIDEFLADLQRSRTKYPRNGRMFDGLMGEADELRRAYTGDGDIRAEAFDVAVCAFRIATEGDAGGNELLTQSPAQWVELTDDAVYAAAEVAWRAGWAACRDAEYVGEAAEDEEWGYQGATIAQDTETKLREKNTRPQPAEPSASSSSPKGPSI
jgi:hypothetical protein